MSLRFAQALTKRHKSRDLYRYQGVSRDLCFSLSLSLRSRLFLDRCSFRGLLCFETLNALATWLGGEVTALRHVSCWFDLRRSKNKKVVENE